MNQANTHDLEAERSVIGSALVAGQVPDGIEILPDEFVSPPHRAIWQAILELESERQPVDVVLLADVLRKNGDLRKLAGGEAYLVEVAAATPTALNIAHYARLVKEKARLRQLAYVAGDLLRRAQTGEESSAEIIVAAEEAIRVVAGTPTAAAASHLGERLPGVISAIEDRIRNPARHVIKTGLRDFDDKIGGLFLGQLIAVGATPGLGKSSFLWSTALRSASAGTPWLIFSLEMFVQEVGERALALTSQVPQKRMRTGMLEIGDMGRIRGGITPLKDLPVFVDDARHLTVEDLCRRAIAWRRSRAEEIVGIAVDYMGLLSSRGDGGENRNLEVARWSRALKVLAGDARAAVVEVLQLTREVAKQKRKPSLHDLRDSGSLEADTDMVIFTHREANYGSDSPQEALLIVAKHRGGSTGEVPVLWHGPTTAFYDSDWVPGQGWSPPVRAVGQ